MTADDSLTGPIPAAEPRTSAAVILLRQVADAVGRTGVETYLVARRGGASFMPNAFVFPGGVSETEDGPDPRVTAARELAEECGVLVNPAELHYFAHWVTPSIERRRYSAHFFVAVLPPDQTPAFDNDEVVDEVWLTPAEALDQADRFRLPPPQLRMLLDLAVPAAQGTAAVLAYCHARAQRAHTILPRVDASGDALTVLLPWDTDYLVRGEGEALLLPADHPDAVGPSRLVLGPAGWAFAAAG